jgi:hypothetical protein
MPLDGWGRISVKPATEKLKRTLVTVRHVPDDRHGFAVRPAVVPLYDADEFDDGLTCPPGLEAVVRAVLGEAGYPLRPGDRADWLPERDLDDLAVRFRADVGVLALLRRANRGLVRYDPAHVDPAWLIAQMAIAWHGLRIVVLTLESNVFPLADRIRRWVPDVTAITARCQPPKPHGRVVVGSYGYLGVDCARTVGLVTAVEADKFVGLRGPEVTLDYMSAKRIGFLPVESEVAPAVADDLACHFGFDEATVLRHGYTVRPARVLYLKTDGLSPIYNRGLDELDLRRHAVWNHPGRNKLIVGVAKYAHQPNGNASGLLNRVGRALGAVGIHRDHETIVLVEGVDHALRLARHLPGWPIITNGTEHTAGLEPSDVGRLRKWRDVDLDAVPAAIVTYPGMERLDLSAADVLVRADGGTRALPLRPADSLYENRNGRRPPALVIDLDDRYDDRLGRAGRRRQDGHERLGWCRVGEDEVDMRVRRWVQRRPMGKR